MHEEPNMQAGTNLSVEETRISIMEDKTPLAKL